MIPPANVTQFAASSEKIVSISRAPNDPGASVAPITGPIR